MTNPRPTEGEAAPLTAEVLEKVERDLGAIRMALVACLCGHSTDKAEDCIPRVDRSLAALSLFRQQSHPAPQGEVRMPLILKHLADWERVNGTLAGITPDEWMALMEPVTNLAVLESPRMAVAALAALPAPPVGEDKP